MPRQYKLSASKLIFCIGAPRTFTDGGYSYEQACLSHNKNFKFGYRCPQVQNDKHLQLSKPTSVIGQNVDNHRNPQAVNSFFNKTRSLLHNDRLCY